MDSKKIDQPRSDVHHGNQLNKPTRRRVAKNSRLYGTEKQGQKQKPTYKNNKTMSHQKKQTEPIKRRNKYANVASSGYGTGSYKPSTNKRLNDSGPSKASTSTTSTKTSSTNTSNLQQNNSRPLNRKKNNGPYKQTTRLPAIRP